jgi:hypothetical protein
MATSSTGQAPLSEPFDYNLDTSGIDLEAARDHTKGNVGDYPWIDEGTN